MKFLQRVKSWFGFSSSLWWWGVPISEFSYKYREAYQIPLIRAAVDYIAKSCSAVPLHFYDKHGNIIDFYPRPNKYQGWTQFVEDSVRKKYLFGFNAIKKTGNEYHNLNITYTKNRTIDIIEADSIRYFSDPYDNKKYLPLLETADIIIERHNLALQASMNILKNAPSPGIITAQPIDGTYASGKLLAEAEKEYQENYTGGKNFGKIPFVKSPIKFEKTLLNFNETGLLDFYKFDVLDVCRIFNIPSVLMGDTTASTYNNVQEASKRFTREVVIPELDDLCETLTYISEEAFMNRAIAGGFVSYDVNDLIALSEERATIAKSWLDLFEKGIISETQFKKLINR